ncbi:hypothetical protein MFLAVUS_003624 [Mucor flavus]|uniref:Uncharacterized protein n=1 Tax=Mucor flavus TaxID=439312 RepID=A0ABP9YTP1_9FUNG
MRKAIVCDFYFLHTLRRERSMNESQMNQQTALAVSTMITHRQAACIFYGEPINEGNEKNCEKRVDDLIDIDICYLDNTPFEPFFVAKVKMEKFPNHYKSYPRTIDSVTNPNLLREGV